MKTIRKILLVGLLSASVAVKAATLSTTIFTNGVFTNFPGITPSILPLQVTSVIVANPSTNAQTVLFYDVATNYLTNYVAPYTNSIQFLTNYAFVVTNYYGNIATNTNYVLFTYTNNAVAGITNTALPKLILTVPGTSTISTPAGNFFFYTGLWVTNSTAASAGNPLTPLITINYK